MYGRYAKMPRYFIRVGDTSDNLGSDPMKAPSIIYGWCEWETLVSLESTKCAN